MYNLFLKFIKINKLKFILSLFIFLFLFLNKTIFALEIPVLKNYVNDYTNTLTSTEKNQLESKLSNFDKTTSNQVVVLILDSLNDESYIEDYSIKVAEKNKIGTKEKNNGVLLTIIKSDRKLRIEVGYGLEGFLTDSKTAGYTHIAATLSKPGNASANWLTFVAICSP